MASGRRHWKEKGGRFYARIAIPEALRGQFEGKTELIEPLGADRRVADREHAAAVARMQRRIEDARNQLTMASAAQAASSPRPFSFADGEHAARVHYNATLKDYETTMASMPTIEVPLVS